MKKIQLSETISCYQIPAKHNGEIIALVQETSKSCINYLYKALILDIIAHCHVTATTGL